MSRPEWKWPFDVGDRVTWRPGSKGPLVADLAALGEAEPDRVFVVHGSSGGGRWITLRDEQTDKLYGRRGTRFIPGEGFEILPNWGHSYFIIAGECGGHRPKYDSDVPCGWRCSRCDALTPEAVSTYWVYQGA